MSPPVPGTRCSSWRSSFAAPGAAAALRPGPRWSRAVCAVVSSTMSSSVGAVDVSRARPRSRRLDDERRADRRRRSGTSRPCRSCTTVGRAFDADLRAAHRPAERVDHPAADRDRLVGEPVAARCCAGRRPAPAAALPAPAARGAGCLRCRRACSGRRHRSIRRRLCCSRRLFGGTEPAYGTGCAEATRATANDAESYEYPHQDLACSAMTMPWTAHGSTTTYDGRALAEFARCQ